MPLLDELLVGLGFEYDPDEMERFQSDIDSTVDSIKKLVGFAVAAATAITAMTVASTAASDEQGKLASEIGDSVENIDALQFALRRAGGSSEGMSASLRTLAIRAAETARGVGSGIEAFGLLGISVTDQQGNLKTTSDLMIEVSQRFQGLGKAQQIELADKLGLRDSILLLQQGPEAIRELTDEARRLGVTTGEDAAIAEEFQDSLTDLWQIMKSVSRTLSRTFAPILKSMVKVFTEWWKVNREIIEQNIPIWIDKFTQALKFLSIAVGVFLGLKLLGSLVQLITLLRGVSVAALLMNVAMFILPALIGAIIVAIAALAEDAKVFFEGGESFIGDMIKKYPEWENQIVAIAAIFNGIAQVTGMIFEGWRLIFDLFDTADFTNFKKALDSALAPIKFAIEVLLDPFGKSKELVGDFNKLTGNFLPDLGNSIANTSSTVVDKIEIVIQGGADSAENIANAVHNVFQQTSQDLNTAVDQ